MHVNRPVPFSRVYFGLMGERRAAIAAEVTPDAISALEGGLGVLGAGSNGAGASVALCWTGDCEVFLMEFDVEGCRLSVQSNAR
ncbi:hypothetical protein ONS95_007992 [Cadophora gregata]|uniref:uncharacterized protein n=1 Tax=Cadophora gregata TaxID=51156 RepID=UPI0026DDC011|nr:uncharacterized protein ONS95_007992 [Cadophora gregata]KAK0119130.1 hypothetical protein ONS96_012197 [Cadophora gregata f. sp. sojae]KAK0126386.1 hypothetical protein ONS95_007992 [Cadophora gregata]